jgi:hypothetical protein
LGKLVCSFRSEQRETPAVKTTAFGFSVKPARPFVASGNGICITGKSLDAPRIETQLVARYVAAIEGTTQHRLGEV